MAKPCFTNLLKKHPDLHSYLSGKVSYDEATGKGKDELIAAAKELQQHSINTINDIYADLKIEGFTKKDAPLSEKVKPFIDDIKGEVNRNMFSSGHNSVFDALEYVSDQWHDEGTREATENAFPKEIVDLAKEKFPQKSEQPLSVPAPVVPIVEGKNEDIEKLQKIRDANITAIEKETGLSEEIRKNKIKTEQDSYEYGVNRLNKPQPADNKEQADAPIVEDKNKDKGVADKADKPSIEKKISWIDFLKQKGYNKWYKSNRPIARYEESGSKRISEKQFTQFEKEYENLSNKENLEEIAAESIAKIEAKVDDVKVEDKTLADKIRQLKTKRDKLQTNIFGIPIAIYDAAIETIATAVEAGTSLAKAIQNVIKDIRDTHAGFQEKDFVKHIEDFAAGEKPRIRVQVGEEKVEDTQDEETGIKHEATAELRKKYKLGSYERDNATDAELESAADEAISKGYDPEILIQQMERGTPPTGVENFIIKKYLATLESKFDKNPSDANLAPIERLVKATDKIGSLQSEAFRTRKGLVPVDDSLAGYFITEKDVNLGAPLTETQKERVRKEYADISEAQKKYDKRIAVLEAENARLIAEAEVKKIASRSTAKKTTTTKRTHEDFVKERRDILNNIKTKLKKARSETNVTPVPYAKELVTIAPDVAKLVRNLVEEGVTKLSDIVADIHDSLKDSIEGLTRKDIHNIIAGEYTEQKPTKNEITKQVFELKQQAQLINKHDKLEAGIEPKKEKDIIKRNQELEALRNKIKEHDLSKLAAYKSNVNSQINKLEEDLRTENFLNPKQVSPPIKLDEEALAAKDKLIKLKNERHLRILLHQHENMTARQKALRGIVEIFNIPRTLMTIIDYSALLRQGIIPTISHPILAASAAKKMIQAGASQTIYDRWFYDLKETPRYELMERSKLGITDSTSPLLAAREEGFMSSLAEKIPIIGRTLNVGKIKIPGTNLVKGSERSYSMFLNKMRVDLFNRFADAMEERGLDFENSPEEFKQMADYVNNSTGRGNVGSTLNKIAPLLNAIFFSPRLIASRLNMLTYLAQPRFYSTVPKEVRVSYFKDMAKFIGVGTTVVALASLRGGDDKDDITVEVDPRSSDFGKIKQGNTRWDIWGGFQPYIRVASQAISGNRKTAAGELYDLSGDGPFGQTRTGVILDFGRSKLAPVPAMAVDLFSGRTLIGDKIIFDTKTEGDKQIAVGKYLSEHLLPLTFTGVAEAMKDQGIKALFTVGVPSVFGVGTQTYESSKKTSQTFKIYNPNAVGAKAVRESTPEEYKKFVLERDKLAEKKIKAVKDIGIVWLNKYDELTIDENDRRKSRKPTDEDMKEIESRLKEQAGMEVKKKIKF